MRAASSVHFRNSDRTILYIEMDRIIQRHEYKKLRSIFCPARTYSMGLSVANSLP